MSISFSSYELILSFFKLLLAHINQLQPCVSQYISYINQFWFLAVSPSASCQSILECSNLFQLSTSLFWLTLVDFYIVIFSLYLVFTEFKLCVGIFKLVAVCFSLVSVSLNLQPSVVCLTNQFLLRISYVPSLIS